MRLDGAELLVLELAADEAVGELAWFDVERRDVAGDLFACFVTEDDLQYRRSAGPRASNG